MSSLSDQVAQTARGSTRLTIEIYPHKGWQAIRIGEVWRSRDLLLLLCLRDVTVRYKQATLGIAWAVLQPLTQMVVMNFVFGRLGGMNTRVKEMVGHDVPYPVFLFSGLIGWQLFASAVNACSNSLLGNANMLRKIYIPRLLLPMAALGAPAADFVCSFLVLVGLMIYFKTAFTASLLLIPLVTLSTLIAALAVGLFTSALTVTYRDFKFVIPFCVQIGLYLTPVIYPVTLVDAKWHWLLQLNPMAGPVEAFRAAVLGLPINCEGWAISTGVAIVILMGALAYFSRVERRFADMV